MLAKLAFRNVRRSVRDYAIYFVTLVFGVAVFYAFNSVTGQSILFDLEDTATASVFEMTGQMLGMFSVVIACVLGFLVLYANGFLIRRRKQEFGTYLMLGMNPSSVSVIVLLETVAVGLVSLGVGLALGFALSQGLSFVTAGLFNIQMEQYRFVFSTNAFLLTLGCFVLIFAVTGLFNTLSIRRYKLIDLLSARSKNARFRVRMVAGTFLFFWSLAGFALAAIERTRGIYFKGLAMFTTRQIASKVNTAFVSLSVVCIMLFFSLTVFSTGMGLARAFSGNVEEGTLYDATLTRRPPPSPRTPRRTIGISPRSWRTLRRRGTRWWIARCRSTCTWTPMRAMARSWIATARTRATISRTRRCTGRASRWSGSRSSMRLPS